MTHGALRVSAIALGVAVFVSLSPLSMVSADTSTPSGMTSPQSGESSSPNGAPPTTGEATPSLSEPTPTPGLAEAGPQDVQQPSRSSADHYARHYAWRNGHRYYSNNPVAFAATGVVGGLADLGSIAAYPIYCFPRYGSCPVYRRLSAGWNRPSTDEVDGAPNGNKRAKMVVV
jgi:hypothetical protein